MIGRHGDSAWQPTPPTPQLTRHTFTSPGWRNYLRAQGYTDAEADEVLDDMPQAVEAGLAQRLEDDRGPTAIRGLVVAYLDLHPPHAVLDLPPAPVRYLDAEQFGRRLQAIGEHHELGQVHVDLITGNRWVVASASVEQTATMVTASALFRALDVQAPAWRLVSVEGSRAIAAREPRAWHAMSSPGPGNITELHEQLPVDAWLAWTPTRTNTRHRLNPIPGLSATVRWDMRQAMGYQGAGRRDGSWGTTTPLQSVLDDRPGIYDGIARDDVVPMLRRIDAFDDALIRRAVQLGQPGDELAAAQLGTLIARRESLRAQLARLTGG